VQNLNLKVALSMQPLKCEILNEEATLKILANFSGDIRQIANSLNGKIKIVFNQKGDNFSFCLLSNSNAKEFATELQKMLSVEMKFGGNDNFVSGGGIGVINSIKIK
jgi:hypothetical protein